MPAPPAKSVMKDRTAAAELVQKVTDDLVEVLTTPLTRSRERYLREVVAVARAAAIGGEYAAAFKGYETVGKVLGHITPDQQQVHLHNHQHAHLTQASDQELAAMLAEATTRTIKTIDAAPAPQAPADSTLEALCA